jgi:two-component system, chemotaxis family, response regulator Rcp1
MVLLDIALPKIDGAEVLAQIRNDEKLRHLPVVILTASEMDEVMLKQLDVSADCYILKPLTLERYLETVRFFPQIGLSIVKIAET